VLDWAVLCAIICYAIRGKGEGKGAGLPCTASGPLRSGYLRLVVRLGCELCVCSSLSICMYMYIYLYTYNKNGTLHTSINPVDLEQADKLYQHNTNNFKFFQQ
jgi:hypothetical protein